MLSPSAVAAVRDAARAVLAGDDAPVFRLPADVTADAFVEATDRHRLLPFFSLNLDRLDLADDLRATIAARGQRERMPALMMARELFRAVDALSEAGVRVLTFKGIALAQQAYGDFTARGSGDLDLLVSPDDLVTARTALVDAGWAADTTFPTPGPSWAWRHTIRNGYEIPLLGHRSSIDLHWSPDPSRSAFAPFETLWDRRATVPVAGASVSTFGLHDALRHSCSHAAKDDWGWLRSIVDISQLLDQDAERRQEPATTFTRAQRQSLRVASRQLGSRSGSSTRMLLTNSVRGIREAERRQAGPADAFANRPRGYGMGLQIRRWGRGVSTLSDARRVTAAAFLPPNRVAEVTDEWAVSAVLRAFVVRLRQFRRK